MPLASLLKKRVRAAPAVGATADQQQAQAIRRHETARGNLPARMPFSV
jgi:hypothetical protein